MQPDQPTSTFLEILAGSATEGFVGAIVGVLGTLLVVRLTTKRREVSYAVNSISLLSLNPAAKQALKVTVDKPVLTDFLGDAGEDVPVHQAYAIEVKATNTGNDTVSDVVIDFELLEPARIASFETSPVDRPDFIIERKRDLSNQNIIWVRLPYLNEKGEARLTIVAVEGQSTSANEKADYKVEVRAKDVRVKRIFGIAGRAERYTLNFLAGALLGTSFAVVMSLLTRQHPVGAYELGFLLLAAALLGLASGYTLRALSKRRRKP